MGRGRKADLGTYEARDNIVLICNKISMIKELSSNAHERVIKAVKFGLGIKENVVIKEEKNVVPIKKAEIKNNSVNNVDGDEYFAPDDCYEA